MNDMSKQFLSSQGLRGYRGDGGEASVGRRAMPGLPQTPTKGRVIRASELGQYAYCARAWWLQTIRGVAPANTGALQQGEAAHRQHGRAVWLAGVARRVAIGLLALAALLALLTALR